MGNPVDTRRRFNVYKTSIQRRRRRIDVLQTLKRRRVSTGKKQIVTHSLVIGRFFYTLSTTLSKMTYFLKNCSWLKWYCYLRKLIHLIKQNYQLVSSFFTFLKLFERRIFNQWNKFIEPLQFNLRTIFCKNHNTQRFPSKRLEQWKEVVHKGNFVGAIYMDLSKRSAP